MSTAERPPRRRGRALRVLRRILVGLLVFVVVLTAASLIYNAATAPPDRLTPPDGSDVTVDGTRVHYREWGGSGPTIVLIGGFLEASAAWDQTAPTLARDHHVYALDLAGYGYTDYTGRYDLASEAALVRGFITTLHLDRPALVGHSMGAAVAGAVALAHPDQIRGIVFADGDALPFGDPERPSRSRDTGWFQLPYVISLYRLGTRTPGLYEPLMRQVCGSRCTGFTPENADAWVRPMRQGDAERALPQMAREGTLALTGTDIRRITVPRAIIWGSEDATGGGSLDAARTNLDHPAERILDGAGHLSMLADPPGFAAAVTDLTDPWR